MPNIWDGQVQTVDGDQAKGITGQQFEGGSDALNKLKPQNLMDELANSGVKYNPDEVIVFADYALSGNTYRIAYGTNGYSVSFYPID